MEAESKALAAALFVVGERERDHWTAAGQQLLAAITRASQSAARVARRAKAGSTPAAQARAESRYGSSYRRAHAAGGTGILVGPCRNEYEVH